MKIEQQSPALSPEYNQEVQVKMTLSEFKTILAIVAGSTPNEIYICITLSKSRESTKYLHDGIKPNNDLYKAYHSMKEQYLAIPKKPKFQPIQFTIESEEELIALKVATGKINGSTISNSLCASGIKRNQDEVDQIYNKNYAMFCKFDKIFEGQVK
jgi:hypothetical protein